MTPIQTTLGKIDTGSLGRVNIHEHIVIEGDRIQDLYTDFVHNDVELISGEVREWRNQGGGVIVDCSPIDAGRSALKLKEVSRISGVPIIVSTGFHKEMYYPEYHWIHTKTSSELFRILEKESENGIPIEEEIQENIPKSRIYPGIIKMGIDTNGFSAFFEKIFPCIQDLVKKTGLPLIIHTEPGSFVLKTAERLIQSNIPGKKVVFCHMDKSTDIEIQAELAIEGFFLEYDSMIRKTPSLEELAAEIEYLLIKGLGDKILFGGDYARRSYWKCYDGNPGLPYLVTKLYDDFSQFGLAKEIIDEIWIENPKKLFE